MACAVEAHVLRHKADIELGCRLVRRHGVAEHLHGALVLVNQPHEDADGGGLAGSVGPDKAHDAAGGQFKMDVLKGEVGVALADTVELDGKIVHTISLVGRASFSRFEASLVRRAISSLLRPSSSPSRATFSSCSENSSVIDPRTEVRIGSDEGPLALLGDDQPLALQLEVGALDGDHAYA